MRAYRLEAVEAARANSMFRELNRALMRMTRTRSGVDPMLEVLGGAAVALVMGFAGWRAAMGSSSVGNFTGFVAALLIASQPLRALGSLNAALQEGLAGLSRVFAVVDEPRGIAEGPRPQPHPPRRRRAPRPPPAAGPRPPPPLDSNPRPRPLSASVFGPRTVRRASASSFRPIPRRQRSSRLDGSNG